MSAERETGRAIPPRAELLARALAGFGRACLRVPRVAGPVAALVWCAFLWQMSGDPGLHAGPRVGPLAVLHNLAHAPAFGFLALLVALTLRRRGDWVVTEWSALRVVWVIAILYGVVDELHQGRVPNRDGSSMDVLSDAVGSGLVLLCARYAAGPHADTRRLGRTVAWGLVACVACAVMATFVPDLRPEWRWL